jgi:glycerol uptake facilitator-like aquaporin
LTPKHKTNNNRNHGGGCYLSPTSTISPAQAYLIESVLSFILSILAFGVGLDPRQAQVFGPKLGPFLTACSLALITFSSVGLGEGYPGAGVNPTRCFAFAVARGEWKNQWIWWIGPLTGGLCQAVVYHIVPPYHREIRGEEISRRSQ